jgi:type I restriction enzyme M protein
MATRKLAVDSSKGATDAVKPDVVFSDGLVTDFASRRSVRGTAEEVHALQAFARRLVEDYGYSRDQIQTHPQFRVIRKSHTDQETSFPVGIAIFKTKRKVEEELFILVDCQKPNAKEGLAQLKLYLALSSAEIGVWFNGAEHAYLRKLHHSEGEPTYQTLPNIPRAGEHLEDVGKYRRADLRAPSNLKAVFRDLRNHLAGNTTGITRDEALAQEIINLLLCKIFDELNTNHDEIVTFRCGLDEADAVVKSRIVELFEKKVKRKYSDVFAATDSIGLDAASLSYVVGELQSYCLVEADRDAIGDAFEVFIGPALRGSEGQFFTPRNVVKMVVSMLGPVPGETMIDPACGSGGFLITALEYVWGQLEAEATKEKWTPVQLKRKKVDAASKHLRGIEKDSFLAKVTKAYLAIIGDGRGVIFCENALLPSANWHVKAQESVALGAFDVVFTNPPFGSKIPVKNAATLGQYDLGHRWKRDRESGALGVTEELEDDQAPHILFLERCLQLLRPKGRLGIVLPESILGSPSYEYVIEHLWREASIRAVVTLPEALFKTSGKGGTHTKVCVLILEKVRDEIPRDIFMADAKWCGHDSRGNPTIRFAPDDGEILLDEVPEIAERYLDFKASGKIKDPEHRGFLLRQDRLRNRILVPKYYDPELGRYLVGLRRTHTLVELGNLVADGVVTIENGTEIGKMAYGTGRIPFIRTSDISNWELKADFKHGVSEAIYENFRGSCDAKAGDILLVRDGTYLIGATAIVTASDLPMLFQSHLLRIRVVMSETIDPWLLFACMNAPVVRRQVRSKQFTQDIIDTLGQRVKELLIPLPKSEAVAKRLAADLRSAVETRVALRNRASQIALEVEGLDPAHFRPDLVEGGAE